MNKKMIILLSITAIIVILFVIFIIHDLNKSNNPKIIYYDYLDDDSGIIGFKEIISIYDNGVIEKKYVNDNKKNNKIQKNKLSKVDLNELKCLIEQVEESDLISKSKSIKVVLGSGLFQEEYIDLNRKIMLYICNRNSIITTTNYNVEKLNKFIINIKEIYLKEE